MTRMTFAAPIAVIATVIVLAWTTTLDVTEDQIASYCTMTETAYARGAPRPSDPENPTIAEMDAIDAWLADYH